MIETKLKIYKRHHFWTFIKHTFGGTIYIKGNTKQCSLKEKKLFNSWNKFIFYGIETNILVRVTFYNCPLIKLLTHILV